MQIDFSSFPTWMFLNVDGSKFKDSVATKLAIESAGITIGNNAWDVLKSCRFDHPGVRFEADLILVTPADLGHQEEPLILEFCDRVTDTNLIFLPKRWAAYVRLDYKNQPEMEWVIMGSMPHFHYGADWGILAMAQEGKTWLTSIGGEFGKKRIALNTKFAFARRITRIH